MNKPICRPCGLVAGQPCCGNKCEREDMICVSTEDKNGNTWKTCKSCGGPGDPCCASPRNPCDPGYVCGSDPSNSSKSICLPCGSTNQNCCSNGPACAGSLQCLPNPTDLTKKTCQECGGPGQACCKSPRRACQGDMACDGGKCVGSCSVRCEYGGLSGKEGVQDHGACLRYAQTLCDSCDMKNDRIARVRYNGNYIFNLSTLCGTKERCCREDSTCDLGLKCTAIDVPQCGTGERKTCQ